jgi:hypothetical protein
VKGTTNENQTRSKETMATFHCQSRGHAAGPWSKAGGLRFCPSNESWAVADISTVFSRFDDPKAAKELVPCNQFSGKWNFFFVGSVESALEELAFQLQKVLA